MGRDPSDPGPARALFSRRDDVTLCNPVGPPCRGPELVDRAGADQLVALADRRLVRLVRVHGVQVTDQQDALVAAPVDAAGCPGGSGR